MIQDKIYDALKKSAFLYLDDFMNISLRDEDHGYYTSNKAIGKDGDFVTAPEISQMFGDIIAVKILNLIHARNIKKFNLIELGAGNGEMMKIFIESFKKFPVFFKSCNMTTMQCETQTLDRNHIARFSNRMSVNNEGTIVYISDNRTGDLVGHTLTPMGSTYEIGAETRRCTSVNSPELTSQVMSATAVEVSPDNSNIVYITSHLSHALQKLQLTDTDLSLIHISEPTRPY